MYSGVSSQLHLPSMHLHFVSLAHSYSGLISQVVMTGSGPQTWLEQPLTMQSLSSKHSLFGGCTLGGKGKTPGGSGDVGGNSGGLGGTPGGIGGPPIIQFQRQFPSLQDHSPSHAKCVSPPQSAGFVHAQLPVGLLPRLSNARRTVKAAAKATMAYTIPLSIFY